MERPRGTPRRRSGSAGFSILEITFVMTLLGILVSMSVPVFVVALEQGRVDLAAANLHALHAAQRVYWLEHRTYAPTISALADLDIAEASIAQPPAGARFVYEVVSAGADAFSLRAIRQKSGYWSGNLTIDEKGDLGGFVTGGGAVLVPSVP